MSLVVLGSAAWLPTSVYGQAFPGGGGGGSSSTTFTDSTFKVCDDGDSSKCIQVQASGISTSTTRTYVFPDVAGSTILTNNGTNTMTTSSNFAFSTGGTGVNGAVRFGPGDGTDGIIRFSSVSTPDVVFVGTNALSNSVIVAEQVDQSTDQQNGSCGSSACTHPEITIMSATAASPQTQYNSQAYWGNAGRAIKTLTESSATSAFQVSIASGAGTGGIVDFTVFASDATDQQTLTGVLQFSGVNKAGTETCPTPTLTGTALNAVSSGTLTCSYAADTTPTNACNIQFNCVSSLTQTTLDVYYRVNLVGPGQVTPQ